MTPALLVSVSALIFTVASFWWLQARRGELTLSGIPAFSGYISIRRRIGIRIPILLYNTGALTRLVDELRLVFPSWDPGQAEWQTFHPTLKPQSGDNDTEDFAGPYPIDGRRAAMRFVQFTYPFGSTLPEPRETLCRVEARLDGSSTWTEVGSFTLHLSHMASPDRFLTYRNSDDSCEGEPESTYLAWSTLADSRGLGAPWRDGTASDAGDGGEGSA
ncbi:MAG: hypothetical protein Q4G40_02205 [Brachybacterium sp.]|nr:hypothetical protein [Brachybacterium sp.]